MKGSSMNTHLGNIVIDNEVIAQFAGTVAMESFGVVGMSGINVTVRNHKLYLDFHIIVSYGVSIMAVADNLVETVKYRVEDFTGLEVQKVNVYVEGVRAID